MVKMSLTILCDYGNDNYAWKIVYYNSGLYKNCLRFRESFLGS